MRYIFVFCFCFLLFSGCVSFDTAKKVDKREDDVFLSSRLGSVSVSLIDASLKEALEYLPSDLNVIYDNALSNSLITLDVVNMPYIDYMYAISKCINADISRHGTVFVFSSIAIVHDDKKSSALSPKMSVGGLDGVSSNYIMWVNLGGWREEELSSIMGLNGLKWIVGDTWVYRGTIEGAIDLSEALDILRRDRHSDYYFEIYFLSSDIHVDFGSSDALGVDFDWRRTFSRGMTNQEWSALAKVTLKTIAELNRSNSARVISGVVREGVPYTCKIGDNLPYVTRSVSDQGTVTDTDVKYENVGFSVNLTVKGSSLGIVDMTIDSNDVSGYQQGYAIKHGSNLKTTYSVDGNDIRYVGSFYMDQKSSGLLSFTRKSQMWDVFVRIERLGKGQYMRKNHIFFQKST